tara:strand:- start:5610 stop:7682 length:2073 start_codon:yes stop_codon:yes gene_type:complete
MLKLDSSLQYVKGVGPKIAKVLEKLSIHKIEDCFSFFPREYDDRRRLPKISECKMDEQVTVLATVKSISEKKVKNNMTILQCYIADISGKIKAIWFNQPYLKKVLDVEKKVILKGRIEQSLFLQERQLNVTHTEFIYSEKDYKESVGIVIPVYSLTHGVHQLQLRRIIKQVFIDCLHLVQETLPEKLLQSLQIIPIQAALKQLHFPTSVEDYKRARKRFVFDEFFYYQLRLEKKRLIHKQTMKTDPLIGNNTFTKNYLHQLAYKLTVAQERVIEEIKNDLKKPIAMNRLLQGDVGSGKTDVAISTLLIAIEAGKSGVLMAPTEILAVQHYLKFKMLLEPLGLTVCLLKSKMRKKEKEMSLNLIQSSENVIVIGTHALIEDYVQIPNLGVVVIDEQHRFGVMQRSKLKNKGECPHCLYMTATPIPRSFMLTCFGDLDKSIIDEMPPGRIPPQSFLVKEEFLPNVYQSCYERLLEGEQIYIVYPLVEESEKIDLKSAEEGYENVSKVFPKQKVGLIHGRMHPDEKKTIMDQFKSNEIQILVSTTVIEVGVDVPNATIMIIRHAERFGLSQLHQLRGRIGRGKKASICYFISEAKTENAQKRLHSMCSTTDGFKIAEYDLMIRGPGDILGTRQSGLPDFKLANLIQDEKVLLKAKEEASNIIAKDPNLDAEEHKLLKEEYLKRQANFQLDSLN